MRVTLRELIDRYKAARSDWEREVAGRGKAPHRAMIEASNRLIHALNKLAGNPEVPGVDDRKKMAGVLDDDGIVFVVVDNNEWFQDQVIEAFLPSRPMDVVEID